MYYLKKLNMIGFDLSELRDIYEKSKKKNIAEAITQSGVKTMEELFDWDKMNEIVDKAIDEGLSNKDEAEIFATLLYAPHFYQGSKIGFILDNSVNPRTIKVQSISDLIAIIKEKDLTDFAIISSDGVRQFQLKRIRFTPTTDSIFNFLKKKIEHYSSDLGNVNLLLMLQGVGEIDNNMFFELNERLKKLTFKTNAEILISYNEENKKYVMNQVYPEVTTSRVDIRPLLS